MKPGYRAFLSYSHRDEEFARWLHRQLEAWKVPADLVGRETAHGPVPRTLRPIFRDRDDFAGGASLQQATIDALQASASLIALCSPHSARSTYVSEEIRQFKQLGRASRIIPMIIAGEPNDPQLECFPPALKFQLAPDGTIGTQRAEPIAADARESGDGRARALVKVVAGLLGLGFDEILQRAERARRRRQAVLAGVGTGAFVFATAFSGYALHASYQAGVAIDRSIFALGNMIERVDGMATEGATGVMRAEMLMTQCDLIQGLARGRLELEPDKATICLSQQVHAVFGRGEQDNALKMMRDRSQQLRRALGRDERPELALAVAALRATGDYYALSQAAAQPISGKALAEFVQLAEQVGSWYPSQQNFRIAHEDAVWRHLEVLEAAGDWSGSFATMQRSADLRALQAKASDPDSAHDALVQQAIFQRRLGWLALTHLQDGAQARDHARAAVALFAPMTAQIAHTPLLAYQAALASSVLADAQITLGQTAEAASHHAHAASLLQRLLKRTDLDPPLRAEIERQLAHDLPRSTQAPP